MKRLFSFLTIFTVLNTNAQDYILSFTGSGASTTVNTITVENLTSGRSVSINGGDILQLTSLITSINSVKNDRSSELKIYPNPMYQKSILQIFPQNSGSGIISIFDINGKLVTQIQCYLEKSLQQFSLSGIRSGIYLITVNGSTYQYSGKLLCLSNKEGTPTIERINNNQAVAGKIFKSESKGTLSAVEMTYSVGDRLKFTGISGNYSTVKVDIPTSDKIINFDFISCTDGDNNNYPVVEIGTQIWMAANLKTIKYLNGGLIGTTSPPTDNIALESSPMYQWPYDGDETNVNTYGRLYSWYALADNVCPEGWHVPSNDEWAIY